MLEACGHHPAAVNLDFGALFFRGKLSLAKLVSSTINLKYELSNGIVLPVRRISKAFTM
jgi:hypothetical protein